MRDRILLPLAWAILAPGALPAQHRPVPLPSTELRPFHSSIVDQDFELYVKLPWSYGEGARTYPLLIALDGNRSFPLFAATSLAYETPGSGNPEIVIVGIGYDVDDNPPLGLADWAAWRNRDLTPEPAPQSEAFWEQRLSTVPGREHIDVESGGAPAFLEAIRREVIPFIEANYRVSATDRGLAGYSLGGLFALYTLFHDPDTFSRYFIGDPSLWNQVFDYESRYAAAHDEMPAKVVFVTAGRSEPVQRLVDRLGSRHYPGLDARVSVLEGEDHVGGQAAAISRGLRLLYDLK